MPSLNVNVPLYRRLNTEMSCEGRGFRPARASSASSPYSAALRTQRTAEGGPSILVGCATRVVPCWR